ncbi:Alpha/Beta hydrolase protein [Desarmillaria tabescens]|uniref:Dipeptidyl-peptidase V n=1 Tax=Armillaria tabescens TaxID=1929756 RepID=A0AA39MWQ0_ARMTA|nr:Alpha/Beta hydrolase protein [Desarmillaria tabescens]KAK0449851.1 Alpha/Beta hydrolase protein [Desarmillaria tabescens]
MHDIVNASPNPAMHHTPSQIASSQKVRDISISPDGERVLYQVQQFYKSADRVLAELWLARTDVAHSARQLTNGDFHDRAGVFHPFDSNVVVFLSDRWAPGKGGNIYSLRLAEDEEPMPLMVEPMKKGVQQFQISPDGKYIAFTSAGDGPSRGDRDDARRIGDKRGLSHLFLLNPITGEVSSISHIRKDRHVESFTWSPDSKELLYRLREDRGPEAAEREVLLERVPIVSEDAPVTINAYPRSPSGSNIWLSSGHILTLQNHEASNILDARTLYVSQGADKRALVRKLYGVTEDAIRIVDMSNHSDPTSSGMIAVEIATDTDTRIDRLSFSASNDDEYEFHSLFCTQDEAIWFGAWDAKRVRSATGVSYVFAAVLSSGIRHEAPNVWSVRIDSGQRYCAKSLSGPSIRKQLSSHLQWLMDAPQVKTEVIRWKSKDGVELSGLVRYPPGIDQRCACALPTILFLHGGPYRRDVPDYMPYFCNWREMLASAGYLVISPNYRGTDRRIQGQGKGHVFAHAAARGIGVFDWPDCESMVHEVVARGLANPDRLAVAGWSHGGSLTAWGVTQTKTMFQAAIVGAGVSNWESMVMEAASPELEGALGGISPWKGRLRKESPVQRVAGVTTAVLILHGEKDERVPLGQGIGLYRSLKRTDSRCKDRVEMVIYPREPHGFVERKHAEDVMLRVLEHLRKWL